MSEDREKREKLGELAMSDVELLMEKGRAYGDSWKKRGGVGALMMLARKWDRIENMCREADWDVFRAMGENPTLREDIQDLRCYLLLVQSEMTKPLVEDPLRPSRLLRAGAERRVSVEGDETVVRVRHPYAKIQEEMNAKEDYPDPYERMATPREAVKMTMIGDTEMREFYNMSRHEFARLDRDSQMCLMADLRMHYAIMRTGRVPRPDIHYIMQGHGVQIYRDPLARKENDA